MRPHSVSLIGLLSVLALVFISFAVYRSKISRAAPEATAPCCKTVAPRELDFPYWSLQDGLASTLTLVSDSPQPIPLTLAIHDDAGDSVFTTTTIQPSQKLTLDLRALIVNAGRDPSIFDEGSVAVYYTGTIMPVVGQITLINSQLHLANESEMVENDPGRSDIPAVLEGLWWGLAGGRDARIMVSNMGGESVTADVFLDFQGKSHKAAPITVPAFGTTALSIAGLLNVLGYSPTQVPEGGITIVQRGPNSTLIAQGQVLGPASGFSSTLEFPDPARQEASALDATGLPVGAPSRGSPYFGAGYFTPHVIARNLTGQPQSVTVTIEYPKTPTWNSANWPGGPANPMVRYAGPLQKGQKDPNAAFKNKPNPDPSTLTGQLTVASLPVGPYSTVDYPISAALPEAVPFCSVRIQYSGPPGSMIAQAASVNAAQDLVVDARMANEGDGWSGSGANPWHLDATTESVLFLANESNQPARVGLSITAENVHYYLTSLQLAPYETRAISIRQLRDAQIADFKGHKIPLDATDGAVNWVRLDDVPMTGRLLVIRKGQGTTSSYDCCTTGCPASLTDIGISPSPATLIAGGSLQSDAYTDSYNCNNQIYSYDVTDSAIWDSDNTSIMIVNGTGLVDGVSGGSTNLDASISGYSYNCEAACAAVVVAVATAVPTDVLQPYSAVVTGTVTQGAAICSSGEAGWSRTVELQLVDQNGYAIDISGIQMADTMQPGTPNDLGITKESTASTGTDNNGSWPDTYFVCSTACPGSGETDALQYWTYNGLALPHANTIVYTCDSITNDGK